MSMNPKNYQFQLSAMSKEKVEFSLPGLYTIGIMAPISNFQPRIAKISVGPHDAPEALHRYVLLMSGREKQPIDMDEMIKGVIEGETRVLAAGLEIEEIFNGRAIFRERIVSTVQEELAQFGLKIYNANIKELEDTKGSEYFVHMRQRKLASAENQARRDIADALFQGDTGVKEKDRDTRVTVASFEAEAVKVEMTQKATVSKSTAEYQVLQAQYDQQTKLAAIESAKAAQIREAELQRVLEERNVLQETERLRSTLLVHARVEAEAKERAADAALYAAQREAEGIAAKFDAEATGLKKLLGSAEPSTVIQYLMIDRDILPKLARENANALQGLQPKITTWITSNEAEKQNPIAGILKTLPPLFTTIAEQSGMKPPEWMLQMPPGQSPSQEGVVSKQ